MTTTQTIRRLPPTRNAKLTKEMQYWELETQGVNPLRTVDTSKGAYDEQPPAAGLNSSTGQTNQNVEITYVKTSEDLHVFTLSGKNLPLGPYTLTEQGSVLKIKSDGVNWWKSA